MKKILLPLLIGFVSTTLYSQDNEQKAIDELNLWSKDYNSAVDYYYEIKDSKEESPEICNKVREAYLLFQSAVQHCEDAKTYYPGYSKDVNLYLVETYVSMAWFNLMEKECVKKIFTDEMFGTCVKKSFELRPYQNSIPKSELKLEYYSADDIERIYLDQVYLGFVNCGRQNNKVCQSQYYGEYMRCLQSDLGDGYMQQICSDTLKKFHFTRVNNFLKNSEEYLEGNDLTESKILLTELYAGWIENKRLSKPDAGFSANDIKRLETADEILKELKDDGTSPAIDQQLMRLYNANTRMGENRIANDYITEAKLHDHSTVDELYDYIEKTKVWRDGTSDTDDRSTAKDRIRRACNLIYEKMNDYCTSADYERLLAYYQYIDDSNGISTVQQKIALKKEEEKKQERREKLRSNWGLSVGIAPGKLIWHAKYNQLSLHANLVTGGFSHGFRYCRYDMFTDKNRFGANRTEEGEPGSSNTYSGWEGSWWINFKSVSGRNFFNISPYLELRYSRYEFITITASVIDRETNTYAFTNQIIDPVGKRFDVTYGLKGTFVVLHRIYFQTVVGLGLGYRWLETGYDDDKYILDYMNFSDDRWPKVTVPFRIGIRAGIILF